MDRVVPEELDSEPLPVQRDSGLPRTTDELGDRGDRIGVDMLGDLVVRRVRESVAAEEQVVIVLDVAAATADDHRRTFGIAMTTLLSEFGAYLDRPDSSPTADLVTYQQMAVWMSHDELEEFLTELFAMVRRLREQTPAPGRDRYLFSPVLFPTERSAGN